MIRLIINAILIAYTQRNSKRSFKNLKSPTDSNASGTHWIVCDAIYVLSLNLLDRLKTLVPTSRRGGKFPLAQNTLKRVLNVPEAAPKLRSEPA
ncbi:hypothetical protein ACV07N_11990 [Roseivirga echinicomitans]